MGIIVGHLGRLPFRVQNLVSEDVAGSGNLRATDTRHVAAWLWRSHACVSFPSLLHRCSPSPCILPYDRHLTWQVSSDYSSSRRTSRAGASDPDEGRLPQTQHHGVPTLAFPPDLFPHSSLASISTVLPTSIPIKVSSRSRQVGSQIRHR